jgi:predicted transcriptional regulator
MNKLVIRVGANPMNDLKKIWHKPLKNKMGNYYTYINDLSELQGLFSSQRLRLILELMREENVSNISKKTGRKQEAISRDASILESAGLITKTRKGRKTFLKTRVKKIVIDLS